MEKPFQNWTRESAALIGVVLLYVDYSVPVARVRAKLEEIAKASKLWDGRVVNLQVSDARENTIELRALVSAANSSAAWDLRCELREKLVAFLELEYPAAPARGGLARAGGRCRLDHGVEGESQGCLDGGIGERNHLKDRAHGRTADSPLSHAGFVNFPYKNTACGSRREPPARANFAP